MANGKHYTDEQKQFVRDNYRLMNDEQLGEKLDVSPKAASELRGRMGLKLKPCGKKMSDDEIAFALSQSDKPAAEIARALRRPVSTIKHLLARVRHGSEQAKIRPPTSKPIPRDWKPSFVSAPADPELVRHVDLVKRVYGTYGGAR